MVHLFINRVHLFNIDPRVRWRIEKMKWMIYIYMHGYENVIVLVSGSFWRSNSIKIKSRNLLMEDSDFLFFFGTD